MPISAIPTGPTYYQPIQAVPVVKAVEARPQGNEDAGQKLRAAQPAGVGHLLDIEA